MHEYRDEVTQARVRVLTSGRLHNEVTYQTYPMWTQEMRHLLIGSRRDGEAWRPHAVEMASGEVRCLVEADADDWALSRKSDQLYFRVGEDMFSRDVEAAFGSGAGVTKVASFEGLPALKPNNMSLDAQENVAYVGVILREKERWGIASLNLENSQWEVIAEVDFLANHVQANPFTPGVVMFAWETGGDAPQRTWVVNADGSGLRPFYKETYEEWVTHEVWWGPDRAIFTVWPYDEAHRRRPHGVVSADLATGTPTVHSQYPAWHTHGSPDGRWAVGDDFDRNLWIIRIEDGQRRLLTQGHLGEGFETHPHPSFTPDSRGVVFNSSRSGTEDVCLVDIPEWDTLPLP